jgi:hypothetical protein
LVFFEFLFLYIFYSLSLNVFLCITFLIFNSNGVPLCTSLNFSFALFKLQAVKSPSLDYTHFISLPLAIHPELVDKLLNFQNSILGNRDGCPDDNPDSDSNEDTTDNEDGEQQTDKRPDVAVELIVDGVNEHVKVNITKIPLVSYAPKASKSSSPSGMPTIVLHDA